MVVVLAKFLRSSSTSSSLLSGARGGVLLEFSIILPILFLILSGMVDLGLGIREQFILVESARTGARAGAKASELSVRAKKEIAILEAKNTLSNAGLNPDRYNYNLSSKTINGVIFFNFAISRATAGHFVLRPSNNFSQCVSAAFRSEDGSPPEESIEDESCK